MLGPGAPGLKGMEDDTMTGLNCVPPQNTLITLDMDTDMTYKHLCVRPSAIDHLIFNQKCINV